MRIGVHSGPVMAGKISKIFNSFLMRKDEWFIQKKPIV